MNLLICCGAFHPRKGGAETLFFDLSALLAERGHRVTVLTRGVAGQPASEEMAGFRILREDWPVAYERLELTAGFVLRSPAVLWRTTRQLARLRIDTVVIGLLDMSAGYLLAARRLVPFRLATYLHGAEIRDLPQASGAYARLAGSALAASDAVVAVSASLARDALRLHPGISEKLTVIGNGVDLTALAAARPVARERPYILYAGRLADEKNVDCIIRAFALAADRIPAVDLVIAGSGPEEGALRREIADAKLDSRRIAMLGAVDRSSVLSLIKGALFLVLASDKESHSVVCLEALCAGKMVLTSRVVGMEELIEEGVNGALFRAGDAGALARLMARYAADEPARRRLESRIAAMDLRRFDLRALADAHLRVMSA